VLEKAGARILAARLALSDQIYSTRNLWIDVLKVRDCNFRVNPKNRDLSTLRDYRHL